MTFRYRALPLQPLWAAVLMLFVLPACGTSDGNGGPGAASSNGAAAQVPPTSGQAEPSDEPRVVNLGDLGFDEGEEGPDKLFVVEFSDFGCVHCANFHQNSYGPLHDEFIEGDMIVWKYIPISIGAFPNGPEAAMAGKCAGYQGHFAVMRDHLYDYQSEWSQEGRDPAIFSEYADELGLDVATFDACRTGQEVRQQLLLNNQVAVEIGVSATPTFLVQGHPVQGAPPLEAFQEVLREMVAELRNP